MPAPTNISADTAIDISALPYSTTQQVDFGGTTYSVWYSITVPEDVEEIGIFAFGDLSVYQPFIEVYYGNPLSPTFLFQGDNNIAVQVPVIPGETYYIKVHKATLGNPTPANLSLSVLAAPTEDAPVGSIFINDDSGPLDFSAPEAGVYPAAVIDVETGEVLRFVHGIPSGEAGDALEDGRILLSDEMIDNDLKLYSPAFELLGSVAGFAWIGGFPVINSHHTGNKWYVGSSGIGATHAFVTTVSHAGVVGPTTWTLPEAGLQGAAASPDETILYFTGQASAAGAVGRWDLVNNIALSDLVAGVSAHTTGDVLVLLDGTILVKYQSSSTHNIEVRRYNAAGTLLNTYSFGTAHRTTEARLAYALDNPDSFWIWTHPNGAQDGYSLFFNIQVSDGTALHTVTSVEFEGGQYQPAETATPAARFGNAFSCPFIILREGTEEPEPEPEDDDGNPGPLAWIEWRQRVRPAG